VYDAAALRALLVGFQVAKAEYYAALGRQTWVPAGQEALNDVDSVEGEFVRGVACVVAVKPG
jgi:hypothetical protein